MQENMQAIERLAAAFSPSDIKGRIDEENNIKQKMILITCSKNSVKLIAKKRLSPQRELLSTQYIADAISPGKV